MMKFFRKKKAKPAESRSRVGSPASESSFYSQHAGETPLDEYSNGSVRQQTHRTSRHSPARIRESSNRASNWAIAVLLLRAVLIVVLLVVGFVALKLIVNHLQKPSIKTQQQWAANATRMEKSGKSSTVSVGKEVPQELVVNPALIGQRLEQWEQTERHLRSAEALTRRGINEEAVQRLEQALRITPDNQATQNLLVDIYMKQGRYAEAVPLCLHLLDQDGRQPEMQMNLLQALQGSGQIDAGLILADRMLRDQPNNQTVLSIAAEGQIKQGNKEAALVLFGRILENDPKNMAALKGCAQLYFGKEDYQSAIPYYLELMRADSKADYYQALARCYARQNEEGKAVVLMGQAASLFGGSVVSPWLKDVIFDPIRETVEFRSFADRLVGIEARKAIEALSKREAEKTTPAGLGGGLELPTQPALNLKSGK